MEWLNLLFVDTVEDWIDLELEVYLPILESALLLICKSTKFSFERRYIHWLTIVVGVRCARPSRSLESS
jgi:hypothetical protein